MTGRDAQHASLVENHRAFMRLAGSELMPAFTTRHQPRLLRVKVAREVRWVLRFAFAVYAKLRFAGFASYSACQHLVSERSISEIASAQAETERALSFTTNFVSGSLFLLNTYRAQSATANGPMLDEGFALLVELLELFQDLPFECGRLGIEWVMNPSPTQVRALLLAPERRFVFADFEAARLLPTSGEPSRGTSHLWTVGDGPHRCRSGSYCETSREAREGSTFDLASIRGQLSHVRLMRIFHCHSVYDPYDWPSGNSQPMDDGRLAAALLDTGAFFVEGSMTLEPTIDFVCTMLDMLLGREDLRGILSNREFEGKCDVNALMTRANALLRTRGFQTFD